MINKLLECFKKNKNNISIFLEIVKYYRFNNKLLEAEQFIKENNQFKNNSDVKFELANIYSCENKKEESITIFEELIQKKDIDIVTVVLELIKLYKQKQEYQKAVDVINIALNIESQNKELYFQKILFQRYIPDGLSAIRTLNEVEEIVKNKADIKIIQNIENVKGIRKYIAPYRCFFTWGMHYNCNYDCSYCYAPKPNNKSFKNNLNNVARYQPVEKIIDSWKYIFDKYGSSRIRLDGGEPSIYPNFFTILKELSKIHRLQVNTNLSFDIVKFCDFAKPDKVRVDASLHCEYTKLEDFVKKLEILKNRGYKLTVSYVGYPDFLENIPLAKKTIERIEIPFFVHPYSGFYENKQYPQSYTEQDKKFIYDIDYKSKTELVWRQKRKSNYKDKKDKSDDIKLTKKEIEKSQQLKQKQFEDKVKLGKYRICEMGRMYARIYPNGNTYRCCSSDGNTYLGNLFDNSIKLLDQAEKCYDIDGCRCWRCMVPGEESRWLHTWLDDWETEI